MNVEFYNFDKLTSKDKSKRALIRLLQNAHAGEKAAANAYFGHAYSLFITNKIEKREILEIYHEELHHRTQIYDMLLSLGSKPRLTRELMMWLIGAAIAVFSFVGTWIIPMYGAGKLENDNIGEYEVAARLALLAGEEQLVEELLHFAEIEWDHQLYFREKVISHPFAKWIPIWPEPKSRDKIRKEIKKFKYF